MHHLRLPTLELPVVPPSNSPDLNPIEHPWWAPHPSYLMPFNNNGSENSESVQMDNSWEIRENDELAPVVLEALPPTAKLLVDKGIPLFEPHYRVPFHSMHPRVPIQSPLQLFLLLLGEETLLHHCHQCIWSRGYG